MLESIFYTNGLHKQVTTRVTSIQEHNSPIIERGTHQDLPGLTPKKRKWRYVGKWERTQSRDVLLRDFRDAQTTTSSNFVSNAPSQIPMPTAAPQLKHELVEFPVQSDTDVDVEMESTPTTLNSEIQSSSTSSSEEPFSAQMQKLAAKIPKTRGLRERSTNIIIPRGAIRKR